MSSMPSFQQAVDSAQTSDTRLILQRLDQMERRMTETLSDHESRIRVLETKQTELGARMTNFQIIQGLYATAAGVVAAFWRGGAP